MSGSERRLALRLPGERTGVTAARAAGTEGLRRRGVGDPACQRRVVWH